MMDIFDEKFSPPFVCENKMLALIFMQLINRPSGSLENMLDKSNNVECIDKG